VEFIVIAGLVFCGLGSRPAKAGETIEEHTKYEEQHYKEETVPAPRAIEKRTTTETVEPAVTEKRTTVETVPGAAHVIEKHSTTETTDTGK
jgi:hypothetical protein